VKYPKLAAAIDELLSKMVLEQGEELLTMAVVWATAAKDSKPAPAPEPEKPAEVEFKQTEVRNGD